MWPSSWRSFTQWGDDTTFPPIPPSPAPCSIFNSPRKFCASPRRRNQAEDAGHLLHSTRQHIELAFDVAEDEVGAMARAYSITSSASASNLSGTSSPSAFAVLRFTIISNLV